jgi:RNA polymerase sporulation-specific sigma factor
MSQAPPIAQGEEESSPPTEPRRTLSAEQQRLVERYAPLCKRLSQGYAEALPAHAEDFLACAFLALVIAARDFDPAKRVKFSTYAWKCIRWSLKTEWRRLRPIGYRKCEGEFPATEPLRESVDPRDGNPVDNRDEVEFLLDALPRRESEILRAVYLEGKSQSAVARERGCSRAYISAIHQSAMIHLNDVARLRAGKYSDPQSLEKPPCASASRIAPPRTINPPEPS